MKAPSLKPMRVFPRSCTADRILAQRLQRPVDHGLGGHPVVGPPPRPPAAIFGAARAENPAELAGDLAPFRAVCFGVTAAAVQKHDHRPEPRFAARGVVEGGGTARHSSRSGGPSVADARRASAPKRMQQDRGKRSEEHQLNLGTPEPERGEPGSGRARVTESS